MDHPIRLSGDRRDSEIMSERTNQATDWQFEQGSPEAYEELFVPVIFSPWADRLMERATIRDDDHVLDVACGTGIVARRVASRVGETGSVVGVDTDEGMLAVATKTATEEGLEIEWREADATELPFADERFNIVLCQQGLPFFDDPVLALEEMRRVVAPGGSVLLNVGRPLEYQPGWEVLSEALSRHIGDEWGAMMHGPFPAWDAAYLQRIAHNAGFDDVSITIDIGSVRFSSVEDFISRQAATSPLAHPIGAASKTARDELIQDVEDKLEDYSDDDGIVFPFESYVMESC